MNTQGRLYIVATPIGNLDDLSVRAARVLREVDLIAAEDTRHSKRLLDHFSIGTRVVSYHEHNEARVTATLIDTISSGGDVALITDAGTPLLSDPGYPLVKSAHEASISVSPVPGASALTAALCVSGIPPSRFVFEGFLPSDKGGRRARLKEASRETRTLIYYETPHRILRALADMCELFGPDRVATVARELTKVYEDVRRSTLGALLEQVENGDLVQKGEFVIVVAGAEDSVSLRDERQLLELLLPEMPPRRAVDIAHRLTGEKKRTLYQLALTMRDK